MARKALLIGSQTAGLTGVNNDIDSMAAALDRWGFASTRCEAEGATRAGILDACEKLIADARPDDAIFVFYSGHGGYCRVREAPSEGRPRESMQLIVPFDFEESVEGDFRGIMASELSVLFGRLTDKTHNLAVALDCCHAAHMARDNGRHLVPKALARPVSYATVASHFNSLRRESGRLGAWLHENNPYSVRIAACSVEQSAYEVNNADGVRMGLLTDALTKALTEAHTDGLRVSWATLADRVRQQVLAFCSVQRPEAEGPAQRLLFETVEADRVATLPVVVNGDRVELGGAPLLGVRVGDEFTIMPSDSAGPDDATKIGDVLVDEVHALAASGALTLRNKEKAVPMGARAYQRTTGASAMAVRLPSGGTTATMLDRAVGAVPILRPADEDEVCPVEVRVDDAGGLTIFDQIGLLVPSQAADQAGIDHVVKNLKRLAWANRLRCLAPDQAHALDTPIEVEFGTVRNGAAEPLPVAGGVVYNGQKIYIRVRNRGTDTVYVSLLDIGVSSQISILNQASPSGEAVEAGEAYTFGWSPYRNVLEGQEVSWPQGMVRSSPRPETVVVLVTTQPQQIHGLEQPGLRTSKLIEEAPRSNLEQLLDQIDHGGTREIAPTAGPAVRYAVRTIDFELVPTAPPVTEQAEFEVDERPEQSALLWTPRSAMPASVAVRLSDLVVHHNKAFRNADIRLDAMILTRGSGEQPVWSAQTERFSDIRDGQTLPLDKMLIYHGPVVDYLDIAVWVTRDSSRSLALADMMQEKLTDNDVQLAMGQIGGLLTAAPQAALAIAAIGAGAVLINTAYHLLRGIVGESIGLYRTTLLASEGFGVGRPADQCRIRAQDFSFSYLIEDIG